jgi:hypothetical protein
MEMNGIRKKECKSCHHWRRSGDDEYGYCFDGKGPSGVWVECGEATFTTAPWFFCSGYEDIRAGRFRPIRELSSIHEEPFAIEFRLNDGESYIHTCGTVWFRDGVFDIESIVRCGVVEFRLRPDIAEDSQGQPSGHGPI